MNLTFWFKNTVIISRMTAVSGDRIALLTATTTAVACHLQPLDPEKTALASGVYGKTYRIWCDISVNILEGDQLRDENDNIYKVRKGGVKSRSFGSIEYKEILIEKVNAG
jgi:hypothetical protein